MNTRSLCIVLGFAFAPFVFGGSDTNQPSSPSITSAPPAIVTQQVAQTSAPAEAEPTEAEMREAVQRHLDSITALTRPPPAPSTSTQQPQYTYSPYWRYGYGGSYGKYSKESDYESWQDVAKRAHGTAKVEITSFKKLKCKAEPDQGGFSGEYIAQLELRGSNPAAQGIMETYGKRLQAFFYKGDKGWICGEANAGTK